MTCFPCPYLHGDVELTEERERHMADQHPDLLPQYRDRIGLTLAGPDQVRRSGRLSSARLFSRWYNDLGAGKAVVVVLVSDAGPAARHWIVTAYLARKLTGGTVEWQKG